jgi:hypothetical protein
VQVQQQQAPYGEPQNQLYTTAITPTLVLSPRYLQLINPSNKFIETASASFTLQKFKHY